MSVTEETSTVKVETSTAKYRVYVDGEWYTVKNPLDVRKVSSHLSGPPFWVETEENIFVRSDWIYKYREVV